MNLRPLAITAESRLEIQRVLDYAKAHPPIMLIDAMNRMGKPPEQSAVGNDHGYTCVLPVGYRCCFSFDQQKEGWFRHLSVSVQGGDDAPNPHSISALMVEFGFEFQIPGFELPGGKSDPSTMLYIEQLEGHRKVAVNVMEKMKEDPRTL